MEPWLTKEDNKLVLDSADRDVLGLEVVWSGIGHELIPNVSSAISRYEGIAAVLFIEHFFFLLSSQGNGKQAAPAYGAFYRVMEQLFEYFLYHRYSSDLPQSERIWCHGIQLIADPEFVVEMGSRKTVAVGLFRYYRGTCYNAGLLLRGQSRSPVRDEFVKALAGYTSEGTVTKALASALNAITSSPKKAMKARDLLSLLDDHVQSIADFYRSSELKQLLLNGLLPESSEIGCKVRETASRTVELLSKGDASWRDLLTGLIDQHDSSVPVTQRVLANVMASEPFLCVLDVTFEFLLCRNGVALIELEKELEVFTTSALARDAANTFAASCYCPQKGNPTRHEMVSELARAFLRGTRAFLDGILAHHNEVATRRSREPIALQDGSSLVVLFPEDDEQRDWRMHLDSRLTEWSRDYYCGTAARLYRQLSTAVEA